MTIDETLSKRLMAALPDTPRWMETRSPLIHRDCQLLGLTEDPLAFVLIDRAVSIVSVVGQPVVEAIQLGAESGMSSDGEVICQVDNRAWVEQALPGWRSEIAQLHLLADESALFAGARTFASSHGAEADLTANVRVINLGELADMPQVPPDLRKELMSAMLRWLVVCAFTDGDEPASFCYAASPTESLWDISIETLPAHQRQGYAERAVRYLFDIMWERRKRPVWGALESNEASLALARKLGFRPVEQVVMLFAPATA